MPWTRPGASSMSQLDAQRNELEHDLRAWMAEGIPTGPVDDARFTRMALRVFAYQFAANTLYRRYCERRGVRPGEIRDWRAIPAVATDAFKEAPLTCFPAEQAAVVFVTSGTTRQVQRGRHYLRSLDLYHASLLPNFTAHLLPDGARLPAVVLFFAPATMPESSLAHMFGTVEALTAGADYFISPAGVDIEGALARLTALADAGQPALIMGTAFAFVHLLDTMAARGLRLVMPPGSRLMDTGGYKGRSREVPKPELYALYTDRLGIPDRHIVNEYGMTEMGSQFYDGGLAALTPSPFSLHWERGMTEGEHERGVPTPTGTGGTIVAVQAPQPSASIPMISGQVGGGRSAAMGRVGATPRRKQAPPWVRTLVVDPETLAPLTDGQTGVLRHYDLANLDSVMALQTADLGFADQWGFEIVGRAAGAEARGCSLAVEELLTALGDDPARA